MKDKNKLKSLFPALVIENRKEEINLDISSDEDEN